MSQEHSSPEVSEAIMLFDQLQSYFQSDVVAVSPPIVENDAFGPSAFIVGRAEDREYVITNRIIDFEGEPASPTFLIYTADSEPLFAIKRYEVRWFSIGSPKAGLDTIQELRGIMSQLEIDPEGTKARYEILKAAVEKITVGLNERDGSSKFSVLRAIKEFLKGSDS